MIALKKILVWLKNFWYIPVIAVLGIIAFVATKGKSRALFGVISNAMNSHAKEVEVIEGAHKEEIRKREEALTIYHATIDQIEAKKNQDTNELNSKEKKIIKKIIEEEQGSPEALAKRISAFAGFDVVMPEE